MAIVRKKPVSKAAAEAFISKAPDAGDKPVRAKSATRATISLTVTYELLAKTDAWAKAHGMSRAAAVAFALSQLG